jgi:DHA1 family multidrug resistance protein-like MFS transporter
VEDKLAAKQPLLSRELKLFMVAMVLANIAGNMSGMLLPNYLTELNASPEQVGLFFTLSRILPLALQILGGWLSDSLGRLRSIAIGSVAGVVSYLGLILAPSWQWVLVGEGLGTVARSFVGPSFSAFIAEQSSEEARARVFGVTQFLFGSVNVIGPLLAGWLAGSRSFQFMLLCAAALYTAAALIRVRMARAAARGSEREPKKPSFDGLRSNLGAVLGLILAGGVFTWIVITDGVGDISFSLSFNLLPVYMEDIGGMALGQIGTLFSIFGVFSMVTNLVAGWLADRRGERVVIALGFVLNFVAYMIFLQAHSFLGFAAAWALFGVGVGMIEPTYQSLTSKVVPERLRGTAFGLVRGGLGLFSLPAPAIGGQLWERVNPGFPFQLTAWATLFSVVPVWLKFKLPDKQAAGKEARVEA